MLLFTLSVPFLFGFARGKKEVAEEVSNASRAPGTGIEKDAIAARSDLCQIHGSLGMLSATCGV